MKRLACLVLVGLVCWPVAAVEPPAKDPVGKPVAKEKSKAQNAVKQSDEATTSVWMEKKLKHSQAILRGLAMGDFEDVQFNASRLKVLNRVEGFVRRRNPTYRAHLNTFSRVSAEIERQAQNRNIEGATLAFNQLTVSCVECHKTLRNGPPKTTRTEPESKTDLAK